MPQFPHWIIAHSGNPIQGLIEVYIGAPKTHGERGGQCAWRRQVYVLHEQLDFSEALPSFFGKSLTFKGKRK